METKFKVGEKVYRKYTVIDIDMDDNSYPITVKTPNGGRGSFTIDGKFSTSNIYKDVFTQEELLAKLQPKSEYPKWMMVSDTPIVNTRDACKRYIVGEDNGIYISVSSHFTEDDIKKAILDDSITYCAWKYAVDIPQELTQKEVVLNRIQELQQEINNLKMEAEKL